MKRRKKIIDEEKKFIKSHLFKKKSLEYIKYQKRQSTKKKYNCFSMNFIFFIILFILISVTYILYIYFGKPVFMFRKTNEEQKKLKIIDDNKNLTRDEYIKKVNNFININLKGQLINDSKNFKKSDNPIISAVITVHNGQGCLKRAVRSVQNQDFLDIEIIIVDDKSEDESVKLIKKLMEEDPRIELIQNDKNRGALYTKAKGVLNAK